MIGQLPHRRVKLLGADIMEIRWVGILPQSLRETCATKDWQPDQTEKHKPQLKRNERLQWDSSIAAASFSEGLGESVLTYSWDKQRVNQRRSRKWYSSMVTIC